MGLSRSSYCHKPDSRNDQSMVHLNNNKLPAQKKNKSLFAITQVILFLLLETSCYQTFILLA